MYTQSSQWYDLLHEHKDYAGEARRVTAVIRTHLPQATTLLDVACGTGGHLRHLRDEFTCHGLDLDQQLLAVARRNLPDVSFTCADITDFELGHRFDAVTCLFSAIGWVATADNMRAAVHAMAGHLRPGGVLVIEPWILPDAWDDWVASTDNVCVARQDGLTVVRVRATRRTGPLTELLLHYVATRDSEIVTADECHRVGTFTVAELTAAVTDSGLSAHWDPVGITGRGLLVGVRGTR